MQNFEYKSAIFNISISLIASLISQTSFGDIEHIEIKPGVTVKNQLLSLLMPDGQTFHKFPLA